MKWSGSAEYLKRKLLRLARADYVLSSKFKFSLQVALFSSLPMAPGLAAWQPFVHDRRL